MNIGLDLGYGFNKILTSSKEIVIPSVIGEGRKLKFDTNMSKTGELDNIRAITNGKEYFVGDLANRQSDVVYFSMDEKKINIDSIPSLVMIGTSLFLSQQGKEDTTVNIVSGLPVTYYGNHKDDLLGAIKQNHKISVSLNGKDYTRINIKVDEVKIIPQPLGTVFNELLNDEGKIENKDITKMNIGTIDIGFKTSDFAVVNKLEYIDRLSKSSTTAMGTADQIIADKIRDEFGVDKPIYQLDDIIRKGYISISGKSYDLREIKEHAFKAVANKIISEISVLWPNLWELDLILVSGGGAPALMEYLKGYISTAKLVDDSQLANARGYLKLANKLWHDDNIN